MDSFDLDVADGEFLSLLGPSGCGKTTTLGIIAGFVSADAGTVQIDNIDVTHMAANRRDSAMVFQNYALFPHLTVAANIGYGLRVRKLAKSAISERVAECVQLMGIPELVDRYPGQLSGGQQQRVAVARALAVRPGVLLMDEPLSNLDARLRADIRSELRSIQLDLGLTVVFVTHDQEEALTMSDRIVLMNRGKVEQVGAPESVYEAPRTTFVADFLGVRNIMKGKGDGSIWRSEKGIEFKTDIKSPNVGVRPSKIGLLSGHSGSPDQHASSIRGQVTSASYQGDTVSYEVQTSAGLFRAGGSAAGNVFGRDQDVRLVIDPANLLPLEASVGGDLLEGDVPA
nr:ABC transporter ATP-binding protein [Ornithinimicrobium cryptoxanthini]